MLSLLRADAGNLLHHMQGRELEYGLCGDTDLMFSYSDAFSRNLGWITSDEQEILRGKRIAIAGLGGVGGFHLTTLTRLGVGAFTLAELDRFELANFNRQMGGNHVQRWGAQNWM